jgi:hypothetical protein
MITKFQKSCFQRINYEENPAVRYNFDFFVKPGACGKNYLCMNDKHAELGAV